MGGGGVNNCVNPIISHEALFTAANWCHKVPKIKLGPNQNLRFKNRVENKSFSKGRSHSKKKK